MASQDLTANSRLAEMQMKFQNKQKLEREQKKLALEGRDISQASKNTTGNGKVRQMFDDRRRSVGIDRSHPLRPIIASTTSTIGTTRTATQQLAGRRPGFTTNTSMQSKNINRSNLNNNFSMSNGYVNVFRNTFDDVENIDNETFPKEFSSLSLNNTHAMGSHVTNDSAFENNSNKESRILGGTVVINRNNSPKPDGIKLNPIITKKLLTTTTTTGKTTRGTSSNGSRMSSLSKTTTTPFASIKSPQPKTATSSTTKSIKGIGNETINTKPATFILSVKPPPRIITPPPGMASCQYCQRHFNEERLIKHEEVCKKMMSKKRKIFDASKHRVQGTEAEKYVKKGLNSTTKNVTTAISAAKAAKPTGEKKSNWRKKHEEFITAIREAKKVQLHLAKGGKLSDLPPPPPSENPDYIQCPHCSRRFNESAAERHIPKCANMQHNKRKPTKKRL